MTKNQKMLLGVGALAVAGYLIYQQMNKKNMVGFVKGEKAVLLDLYGGKNAAGACKHTLRAPIGYISLTRSLDAFVVGKQWFTNFEQQIKYPDGIYSLYNLSNSLSGQWAKIGNGVVTEVGTCGSLNFI